MRALLLGLFSMSFFFQVGMSQEVPVQAPAIPADQIKKAIKDKLSTGVNKQFKVKSDSLRLSKSVTGLCDELAKGVNTLLGEKRLESGFYPIHVELISKGDFKKINAFGTAVRQIQGAGFIVDLKVDIREQINKSDLEAGIMQAIVIERTMRTDPALDEESVISVPRWISDGLLGALRWKEGERERGMYEVLLRKPELFPLEKLFTTRPKDIREMGKTMYAMYEASTTAMVMSLYRQPEGKERLAKMLSEVAVFGGETPELLRKHFPAMNVGKVGLDKVWNLQLAEMSVARMIDTETILTTEKKLNEIFVF